MSSLGHARVAQGEKRHRAKAGEKEAVVEYAVIKRHRAGKAPEYAGGGAGAGEDDVGFGAASSSSAAPPGDRRLQRLAGRGGERSRGAAEIVEEGDGGGGDRRRRRGGDAEIIEEPRRGGGRHDDDEEEEDDDAVEARRERLREVQRRRREREAEEDAAAAAAAAAGDGEEGEEEGEEGKDGNDPNSSSYEEYSESEEEAGGGGVGGRTMLKPVFLPDGERQTIREREAAEAEEEAMRLARDERAKERAKESKALLVEAVRQEEEGDANAGDVDFAERPDDNDEEDELAEYEAWKLRELKRVRRERDERKAGERARAEIERRRGLTDAQRKAEDDAFEAQREGHGAEKEQWRFLQKYYHKGAYFQDEDESGNKKLGPVMARDYGAATGADARGDKAAMPAVMQVKNFGMRSQVKWTHLSKEDTSSKDSLWSADRNLERKAQRMQAGTKAANDFARPQGRKKKG